MLAIYTIYMHVASYYYIGSTVVVVVVYFQTDIYMYNIPKCYLQLIICIYSLRLHQKARPVMVAQP